VNQPGDTIGHSRGSIPTTLAIYRDLRVGMVVIMVMLAAAVVTERMSASRWQSALSEYYYTSAHSIFIAALLALSTLFFVYKGSSDTEDALLTLAGVCTLVAALVPQGWPSVYGDHDLPRDYKVEPVIQPNVWAVVVALVLGWLLTLRQYRHNNTQRTRSPGGTLTLYLLRLIVTLALITLAFWPGPFKKYAHGAAGTLMLTAFIATVFCTAYVARQEEKPVPSRRRLYLRFYRVIAAVMLGTLVAVVTLHLLRPHWMGDLWILVLETLLILEFAVYWVVQTIDLWDTPDRSERLPEDARNRLAQGRTRSGPRGLASELLEARDGPSGQRLLPLL